MLASSLHQWYPHLGSVIWWLANLLLAAVILFWPIALVLRLWDTKRLLKSKTSLLELTPPLITNKSPLATQQLFSVLHGLKDTQTWQDKLLRRRVVISLEVVSSKAKGIRYMVRVDQADEAIVRQQIAAYLPEIRIRRVKDYLDKLANTDQIKLLEFRQTGHFAYPLEPLSSLRQHDPVSYLVSTMTKIDEGQSMVFQLVVVPTDSLRAHRLYKELSRGKDILGELNDHNLFNKLYKLTLSFISFPFWLFTSSFGGMRVLRRQPAYKVGSIHQQELDNVYHKLSQPLFAVNIRAAAMGMSKSEANQRVKSLKASLASLSVPKKQSLRARSNFPWILKRPYRQRVMSRRLPALTPRGGCLLATSELAALYHFPYNSGKTEGVSSNLSRVLPASLDMRRGGKTIYLGRNFHQGVYTPIGLTLEERKRHLYIMGGTGSGKSTMLLYSIVQDLENNQGLAVIDPHGDLAEAVLRHIPEKRIKDVIIINPDDLEHPIGLNLLELPPDLSEIKLTRETDLVTESVVSIFRKLFAGEDSGGHRIEYILRNTVQTALTLPGPTLFTIYHLLTNPNYAYSVAGKLTDESLKNFWFNEIGKAGHYQRVKMSAGVTAKIGRFLASASARNILGRPTSTINFDDILSSGKILICNFSKGLLGEDTATLFGTTVLAKLQLAALRRARQAPETRKDFYLYIDELQNFATTSFTQMLSEARKYNLYVVMAEQSPSQQPDPRLNQIILANVGSIVCFRTSSPADEQLILPLLSPFISSGELSNLPAYSFYARVSAVKPQQPVSGETVLLTDEGSDEIAQEAIDSSRRQYMSHEPIPDPPRSKEIKTKSKSKTRLIKARQRKLF